MKYCNDTIESFFGERVVDFGVHCYYDYTYIVEDLSHYT